MGQGSAPQGRTSPAPWASRPPSTFAWSTLLLIALGLGLGEWPAEKTRLTLLLAYLPPVLWLIPALASLGWVLLRRRRPEAALCAALLAAWGAGLLHWRPQRSGELRVLTYNVARGSQGSVARLIGTLRGADADLLLLQETNFLRPAERAALLAAFPDYAAASGQEVMTLSRWEVSGKREYALPGSGRTLLETEVRLPRGRLRVINAHLGTVLVSSALRGDWATLSRTHHVRQRQVTRLCDLLRAAPGPVLLGGDLNTPPRGQLYRQLRGCSGPNAHQQAGRGPGWTFPRFFLRIDHLFARGLTAASARTLTHARGSDHLPLLAEYHWETRSP